MIAVEPIIARALGIKQEHITDDLSYQSIAEWDSLRHVALMLELESHLGVEITNDLILELRSVAAIRAFALAPAGETGAPAHPAPAAPLATPAPAAPEPTIHRGLEGVYFDRTAISRIDGEGGQLDYRGYSIHDLVEHSTFEESAWLLINGAFPDAAALADFRADLRARRGLPAPVISLIRALAHAHPMEVLRTAVSALGSLADSPPDESMETALQTGVALIAQIPTLIAAHHAIRSGSEPRPPQPELSHAANFLYMLLGEVPSPSAARLIEQSMIVHADHSANASTFAARVAIGCKSNLYAAITAAIATFAGPLHGGAAERVIDLIDAVGSPDNAVAYVRDCQARNQPVMGFGHRVYRTEDPRVRHLRAIAYQLSHERGDTQGIAIIEAVIEAMKPYARHGVEPNVDLYAGLSYRLLGLPDDLAVPMFVAGRIVGWVAQALEQKNNNVLIRPLLLYVGEQHRRHPSADLA